jgi:hypothetical protein
MRLRDHPKLKNLWSSLPWSAVSPSGIGSPNPTPGETTLTQVQPDTDPTFVVFSGTYLEQEYTCYLPFPKDPELAANLRNTLQKAKGQTILQIGDIDIDY